MTKGERFTVQATSGRWLLTVTVGIVLFIFGLAVAMVIVTQRNKISDTVWMGLFANIMLIVQGVYKDYFARMDRIKPSDETEENGKENPPGAIGNQGTQGVK